MITERWERTKQILEDVLRLPSQQRSAYLDSACGGDRELRAEIESLISSLREAGSQFLGAPATEVLQFPIPADHLPSEVIGHYRLLAEIGRGDGVEPVTQPALQAADEIAHGSISLSQAPR